ncbi:MAG TPA: aldehyde dehydrogenase family protein [Nocardia sp.]|uniref:aldehyde dehydrogenase family protein n=1 Tax=Nocardia sp. TaxID=1821 RepID=UPI002B4B0146|nr:aldehyde dehydrogenase family protein [Nocardia sp.]HLS76948.1 aldehyde dehydrogenase family protein [Nocardia sp.]
MTTVETRPDLRWRGVRVGHHEIATDTASDVRNPYDGTLVGRVGQASAELAESAVALAHRTLDRPLPAHVRAEVLDRLAVLLDERRGELAALICAEVGKPVTMAAGEVDRAIDTVRHSAAVARTTVGSGVAMDATAAGAGKLGFTRPTPIGVVTAIAPFNFPLNLVAHKLAPAFAVGCPVVLKPAPQSPLTAFLLADLCEEAGMPEGYLSVVPGDPAEISAAIVEDPRVAAISFTGSAAVGWHIARAAARKKVLLELGNSSPAIIEADAELASAADKLVPSAFGFAGQTCVSVQRVYADEAIRAEFTALLRERIAGVRVGDPRDGAVTCGPVIDDKAADRIRTGIDQALRRGATVETGGHTRQDGVLEPTLLSDVPQSCDLIREEAFGPVLSVVGVRDFDEAIALSNDSKYGLQAAVFTADLGKALAATERLRYGTVLINESPAFRADNMPYGGVRDSGNTKEGPASTARELTVERVCVLSL